MTETLLPTPETFTDQFSRGLASRFVVALVVTISTLLLAGSIAAAGATDLEGAGTEDDPYVITDVEGLQAMNEELDAHYTLGADIDASETERWNAGAGFVPIGDRTTFNDRSGVPFTGSFDGQNHTITGLTIDRPAEHYVALFGYTEGPVENVHLEDATIRGGYTSVGTLVGAANADVRVASATGDVVGDEAAVGGLLGSAGTHDPTVVERTAADVEVTGERQTGGLIGSVRDARVAQASTGGDVSGERDIGGVAGHVIDGGDVRVVSSTGDVYGDVQVGGLAGSSTDGYVADGFVAGSITGDDNVGSGVGDGQVGTHYWNDDANAGIGTEGGIALSEAEMTGTTARDAMSDLDFDARWTPTDELPILEWQVADASLSLAESTVGEGQETTATVELDLVDGSTVAATGVADYDGGGLADVGDGSVRATRQGTTEVTATVAGQRDASELEILEPPAIELTDASLAADGVVAGASTVVTATYENDGGPGDHVVDLLVDGETVGTQELALEAGETRTVDVRLSPDGDAGTEHDVRVDGTDVDSVSVHEPGTVSLEGASFPDAVGSGTPYEYAVDLASNATGTVSEAVTYQRDGDTVATDHVVVEPNGTNATFERTTDLDPGLTLAHDVSVRDAAIGGTSEVREPPSFSVIDLEAPDEVEADDAFELSATLENDGSVAGETTVDLARNGSDLQSETVALEAGETSSVTFEVNADAVGAGEYAVAVGDDREATDVVVTEQPESDADGIPAPGVVATAFVLLTVLALGRTVDLSTDRLG